MTEGKKKKEKYSNYKFKAKPLTTSTELPSFCYNTPCFPESFPFCHNHCMTLFVQRSCKRQLSEPLEPFIKLRFTGKSRVKQEQLLPVAELHLPQINKCCRQDEDDRPWTQNKAAEEKRPQSLLGYKK